MKSYYSYIIKVLKAWTHTLLLFSTLPAFGQWYFALLSCKKLLLEEEKNKRPTAGCEPGDAYQKCEFSKSCFIGFSRFFFSENHSRWFL